MSVYARVMQTIQFNEKLHDIDNFKTNNYEMKSKIFNCVLRPVINTIYVNLRLHILHKIFPTDILIYNKTGISDELFELAWQELHNRVNV